MVAVGRESDVHGLEQRRILSSTVSSEPLGKFPTRLDSSTAYKNADSSRHDLFCRVLSMELLQLYYRLLNCDCDDVYRVNARHHNLQQLTDLRKKPNSFNDLYGKRRVAG
jgi:hypothetical protein